uniref:G1-like ORF's protein n=1 Tax=Dictyostelium mucoroides TaxID=31287 RepID=Q24012_DICMU|nr:G1-like ORF's protein [Dictyostelium mucoroides]
MSNKKRKVDKKGADNASDTNMDDANDGDDGNKSLDAIIDDVADSIETNYFSSILYRSRKYSEFTKHKDVHRLKLVIHASNDHLMEVKSGCSEIKNILDQYIKEAGINDYQSVELIRDSHANTCNLLKNLISKRSLKKKESENYLREIYIKILSFKSKRSGDESELSFLTKLAPYHANTITQVILDDSLTKNMAMDMESIKSLESEGYIGTISSGQITLKTFLDACPDEYKVFATNPLTYKAILLQIIHTSLFVGEVLNKTKTDNHLENYVLDFQNRSQLLSVSFNHQSVVPYRCIAIMRHLPRVTSIDWESSVSLASVDDISSVFPLYSTREEVFSKLFDKFNEFYNFKVNSKLQGTFSFFSVANAKPYKPIPTDAKYSMEIINRGFEPSDLYAHRNTLVYKNSKQSNYVFYSFIEDCFNPEETVIEGLLDMGNSLTTNINKANTNTTTTTTTTATTNNNNNDIVSAPSLFKNLVFQERTNISSMSFIFVPDHIEPKQKKWPNGFDKKFQDFVAKNGEISKRMVKPLKLLCFFIKNTYSYYRDVILKCLSDKVDTFQVDGMCIKEGVVEDLELSKFLKERLFTFKSTEITDLTQKINFGVKPNITGNSTFMVNEVNSTFTAINLNNLVPIPSSHPPFLSLPQPIGSNTNILDVLSNDIDETANIKNFFEPGGFKDIFGLIYDDLSAILYVNKSFKFSRLGLFTNAVIYKGTIITAYYAERILDFDFIELDKHSKPEPIQFFGIGTMANRSYDSFNAKIVPHNRIVDASTKSLVKYLNNKLESKFYLVATENIPANKEIIIKNQ